MLDVGTNEGDAMTGTALSEIRTLCQKTIAGVDRIAARRFRGGDDRVPVEVGARTGARKRVGFIRDPRMQACRVVLRINSDRAQSKIGCGTGNADCDFSAIANQQTTEAHESSSVNPVCSASCIILRPSFRPVYQLPRR